MRAGLGLLPIRAGHFVMGDSEGDANEAPRAATVKPFRLMRHEVTNRQFEPYRDCRRLFCLSHATIASSLIWA